MTKIDLVKIIVRYVPSFIQEQRLYGHGTKQNGDSTTYLWLKKAEDDNPESIRKWECAGGKLKPKETPMRALTREMKEELKWIINKDYRFVGWLEPIRNCAVGLVNAVSDKIDLSNLSSKHSDYIWNKKEESKKLDVVPYADLLFPYLNNPEEHLKK
jgi:8-oxo-dGTP pyrophosphatase MutT (NUDIX family)